MIYRADNWIYRDSIAAYWRMTEGSIRWNIPFTDLPHYFMRPLRVNGMGGVSPAPMTPAWR
jgi:hypothetical protein